jgi:hypothetical protein
MSETVNARGGSIEERDDTGKGDAGLFAYWEGQERIAAKGEDRWVKRGRAVVKRYRDDRGDNSTVSRFNILWSNVQTLKPTLYARTPKPDVQRRFLDQDETGRLASMLMERALSYSLEQHGFDDMMTAVVEDRLLPGRGVARVMYVPHFGEPLDEAGNDQEFDAADAAGADAGNPGDQGAVGRQQDMPRTAAPDDLREVIYEEVVPVYVFWEDYREGPARTWREVPWVRFRAFMTREAMVKRFGKKKGGAVELDFSPRGGDSDRSEKPPPDLMKKAVIHEVWDREKKRVVWYAPGTPDLILDEMDDPLGLPDFFPCPSPLLATTTNDKRIPVPDYTEYQDQARELDTLTARIDKLTKALKVAGAYAGSEKQVLQQLINDGSENLLIPVEDWMHLQDRGGLNGVIQWMPIQQIAQVLIQLYDARDRVKAMLYEVTGIGDIMRGATSPMETLGAQQLKANFSTRRIVPQQRHVASFARDMIKLMAGVIAAQFSADTLSQITGYPILQPVPQLPPPPPQWLPAPMQAPQAAPPMPMGGPPAGAPPGPMPGMPPAVNAA